MSLSLPEALGRSRDESRGAARRVALRPTLDPLSRTSLPVELAKARRHSLARCEPAPCASSRTY